MNEYLCLRWALIEPQHGKLADFVSPPKVALELDPPPRSAVRDSESMYRDKGNAAMDVDTAFAKFDYNNNGWLEGKPSPPWLQTLTGIAGEEISELLAEVLGWPSPMPSEQRC